MTIAELDLALPLAKRARLSDNIVETLSRLIVDGALEPGTIIRTENLARQLGVSRTPMREALQRLELDGFVTMSPSGIAKVASYEPAEALEMLEVREVVDGLAARILAERGASEAVLTELSSFLEGASKASLDGDWLGFFVLDTRFHTGILTATNHKPLQQFHSLVRITSQAVYLRLGHQKLRHRQSSDEHREIFAAIRAGRAAVAERFARRHIKRAIAFWLKGGHEKTDAK
jgi:GntR family transcriptional regulator, vanillate catabolism transcriptional regulator